MEISNEDRDCSMGGSLGCILELIGLVILVWILTHWHDFVSVIYNFLGGLK